MKDLIRRILREEFISVDMKTVQSDLINMIGPSKIKIVNTIGSFNSSFSIIVGHLDQEILDGMLENNLIGRMNTKYTDFKYGSESYIWSGKGPRKLKKTFITLAEEYRKGLVQ